MMQRTATVIENVRIAERTFRVRIDAPDIAATIRPGQFVMLRLPDTSDPLLGRPFALYDTIIEHGHPVGIDIVYLVIGKMTSLLAKVKPGAALEIWGPLGNGFFDLGQVDQATFVAGGIGQTPFLAYARDLLGDRGYGGRPRPSTAKSVALYYGVRTANLAAGVEDFQRSGVGVHLSSDDGSVGYHGFVTQLLARDNPPGPWIGCGPEPMLHALMKLADERRVTCHVSLETPMACGFGVCFSCVTRVNTPDGWDYKRVCVDGPVFDARQLAR
jgi:dihydroorotate dehydrogenase electron transfer subunit